MELEQVEILKSWYSRRALTLNEDYTLSTPSGRITCRHTDAAFDEHGLASVTYQTTHPLHVLPIEYDARTGLVKMIYPENKDL